MTNSLMHKSQCTHTLATMVTNPCHQNPVHKRNLEFYVNVGHKHVYLVIPTLMVVTPTLMVKELT